MDPLHNPSSSQTFRTSATFRPLLTAVVIHCRDNPLLFFKFLRACYLGLPKGAARSVVRGPLYVFLIIFECTCFNNAHEVVFRCCQGASTQLSVFIPHKLRLPLGVCTTLGKRGRIISTMSILPHVLAASACVGNVSPHTRLCRANRRNL
jgi:hypothetical protein